MTCEGYLPELELSDIGDVALWKTNARSASGELIHCDKCKKICRTINGNDHFEQVSIDDKIMTHCWDCCIMIRCWDCC